MPPLGFWVTHIPNPAVIGIIVAIADSVVALFGDGSPRFADRESVCRAGDIRFVNTGTPAGISIDCPWPTAVSDVVVLANSAPNAIDQILCDIIFMAISPAFPLFTASARYIARRVPNSPADHCNLQLIGGRNLVAVPPANLAAWELVSSYS